MATGFLGALICTLVATFTQLGRPALLWVVGLTWALVLDSGTPVS